MKKQDVAHNVAQSDASKLKMTTTPDAAGEQTVVQDDATKLKVTNTPDAAGEQTVVQPVAANLKVTTTPDGVTNQYTELVKLKGAEVQHINFGHLDADGWSAEYVVNNVDGKTMLLNFVKGTQQWAVYTKGSPNDTDYAEIAATTAIAAGNNLIAAHIGLPYIKVCAHNEGGAAGDFECWVIASPMPWYA